MPEFEIESLDHIAIEVADVEASASWYRDVLGLEPMFEGQWGGIPTFVGMGDTGVALFPRTAAAPQGRAAVRHFAFRVDRLNFEAARSDLASRGIGLEFSDHGVSLSIYFRDPDGYRLEITTYEVD